MISQDSSMISRHAYTLLFIHLFILLNSNRIPVKSICLDQRYRFQDAGSLLRIIIFVLIHNVSITTILCVIHYSNNDSVSNKNEG